jgi:hypothetical protein
MASEEQPLRQGARHALTVAALALPGLTPSSPCAAQDNAAVVQFGRYQENDRELYGLSSKFKPIESDSLQASVWFAPTDWLKALINYRQDTWSGATPIATAPREWRGNRSRAPDGVSGASPYLVSSNPLFLDKKTLEPLRTDGFGNLTGGEDTQLVHTLSGASRELRQQLDFNLRREWDESAFDAGGGVSSEPDYLSRFVALGGQWDFDTKLTTLNAGLSYTFSSTKAILDHDATPYIYNACGTVRCNFVSSTSRIEDSGDGGKVLYGDRHDWGATVGLTQILNQDAQVQTNLGFTRSEGYLSNPYKVVEVAFIDPEQQFLAPSPDVLYVNVNSLLDKRPDLRNQWLWNIRYAQYIDATDAGLHLNYAYFRDDWGIRAHTLEASWAQPFGSGWTITPMIRYYTQSAAYFYTPYLVTDQGQYSNRTDPATGNTIVVPFDPALLPPYYSSDYRLSAFGALGGGFTLSKQFSRGVTAYLGYAYYQHSGKLKWGGGGEGSYSDFSSYLVNASLTFDLNYASSLGMSAAGNRGDSAHAGHGAHGHDGGPAPAGVMFDHVLPKAGDLMAGLRYMGSRQSGSMQHGKSAVDDAQVKANACGVAGCIASPASMDMSMFMLELMYAPADWLTLMLMPTYMNMEMQMRGLLSPAEQAALPPDARALYMHHTMHQHTTGGIGDTGVYASFKLFDAPGSRLLATLGVTIPTGDVSVRLRDTHQIETGFEHYGMQLGSGTWDFNPSITWLGASDGWFWGAQASAIARMESRNKSGYALGDVYQGTAWGGYRWDNGLSGTLRGVYTQQGAIKGEINGTFYKLSPVDYSANYGGRFLDLGIGVNYAFNGSFAGNQLGVEWLQPLRDDFNGYQLERRGALYASWKYLF